MLLETCPSAAVLEFKSELGRELKGREIIYHFQEGWFRGRILKQADNMRIKSNGRPCNYRVFYEADDEFLNQALYPETYASDASAPVDGWMLVGGFEPHALALATSPAPPLALLGPADSLLPRFKTLVSFLFRLPRAPAILSRARHWMPLKA